MRIETSELEGPALDWAVAKAVKAECHFTGDMEFWKSRHRFAPSSSWMFGGVYIDRYCPTLLESDGLIIAAFEREDGLIKESGTTYLQATMRAIVASELGDTVDVPDELVEKDNG